MSEPDDPTVGVEDPYRFAGRCDFLSEGRCRFAVEHGDRDPAFARARQAEQYRCPVAGDPDDSGATGPWEFRDCPHFQSREHGHDRECERCGLGEIRLDDERPLLEEHHLSYPGADSHEITIFLCRWCHAKIHDSWGQIDDEVSPDAAAIAERERRRARQQAELGFEAASDREDDR